MTAKIELTGTLLTVSITIFLSIIIGNPEPKQEEATADTQQVAATVNDQPISVSRVQRHLNRTIGNKSVPNAALDRLQAEALEHLVRRHIVHEFIADKHGAGESEIRSEISILESKLAQVDQTIDDHLKKNGQTRDELEYEIAWKIAWQRFLDKKLSEKTLSNYFQRNRRIFDGTEMRVAHILFSNDGSPEQQLKRINDVRKLVSEGRLSWVEAVHKYSRAIESKKKAGEVGWIRYAEPMPAVFNEAAFQLQTGQISQPVRSDFGLHLIKCLEIKPGTIGPRDAQERLREHAMRALFEQIANKHRSKVIVVYTDNWPNLPQLGGQALGK